MSPAETHRRTLSIQVPGTAITQGSKTLLRRHMVDRNDLATKTLPAKRLKHWRERVARTAKAEMAERGWSLVPRPVELECEFYFERPKSHRLKSGKVRKGAPETPRGDVDKYLRAIGDALSGSVYVDDNQVAVVRGLKAYTDGGAYARVTVRVL